MANNNKHTGPNVPALRFPEFSGEWECVPLSTYAKKITEKNKGNKIKNVLCNSATQGIVPQSEYFDREIANNENTDGYYVVRNQDFVYNPRKSVSAPYGPVNIYNGEDDGIISPLYLCMKIRGIDKNFLLHYFKSPAWYPYIYQNGDSGVRHDRVSIKDEVFLAMPVSVPNGDEQRKIAKFLDAINERIATQSKIIEEQETLLRSLRHKLFNQCLDSHTQCRIGDILSIGSGKDYQHLREGEIPVYGTGGLISHVNESLYDGESVCIGRKGTINKPLYLSGRFWTVDTLFYTHSFNGILPRFCYHLFCTIDWLTYNEASGVPSLSKSTIEKILVSIPQIDIQKRIVQILDSIEEKINIDRNTLLDYQKQKIYLLSRMFI